jgi:MFS family permease
VRGWFRQTVGGLPGTFWYLWAGTLVSRAGNFVIIFLALYLTSARHLSPSFVGLVVGLYGVGGAAGTLLGGVLSDRWGRRPTLLLSYLCNAACVVGLGVARDRWAIAVGALLFGTGAEMARPAFAALMVDVVPARDRLRAFTLNYWAINLGFACASLLAGFAAQAGYLLLFVGNAATTLLTALIVLTKVRDVPHVALPRQAREREPRKGLWTVFADRVFISFVALNLLTALVFMQQNSGLPIAMVRDGLPPTAFGEVIALNGVLIVLGQLFVPKLIGKRDRSRVLSVAALVLGAGFGLTAFAHTPLAYAATVLVWTLGEMLNSPSNSTLLADLSPEHMRGRYQGVFSLSWQGAAALTPVLGGLVQQHLGTRWLWLGCAAIGVVVAAAQAVSGPSRERRSAEMRIAEAPATPEPVAA